MSNWETSSGLPIADREVIITDMSFGFNPAIAADAVCAIVTFTPEDGDEDIEQSFTCGKTFEPSRDGKTLEGRGRVNKNTNFGMLLESVKAIVDDPSEIGDPFNVDSWIGTRWVTTTTPVERRNPSTGETKVKDAVIFAEYLGREGADKGSGSGKGAGKGAGKADAGSDRPFGIAAELWGTLLAVAAQHESFDDFTEAALDTDGVDGNAAATKAILSRDGVWAAAGKS